MKAIVLYLHVHQPYRLRPYSIFDVQSSQNYFFESSEAETSNEQILKKVAEKSYLPTNAKLLELLNKYPGFKLSLSITGTVLEQMEQWAPHVLASFQAICETGRVEIVTETFHHSLAFFYSRPEFEVQVQMHSDKIKKLFNQEPRIFRNTELAYNNDLGQWAEAAGYKGILTEGWDGVLGWRSANFVYRPAGTSNISLLMKNYKLSDDIAFRFGDKTWSGWPLTASKYVDWLNAIEHATNFNLFMDYETFGEHQWSETGIFDFLATLPAEWQKNTGNCFMTISEAIDNFPPVDAVDVPHTITWADTERDLSAWLGNSMQETAIQAVYSLEQAIIGTGDWALIEDWRRMQTSDHFYYMCTKWFRDGDIHAYFSPYDNPYDAYIYYMNVYRDLQCRLLARGAING